MIRTNHKTEKEIYKFRESFMNFIKEKKITLVSITKNTGISYQSLCYNLKNGYFDKFKVAKLISDYTGLSIDFLLNGGQTDKIKQIDKIIEDLQNLKKSL